MDGVIWMVGLVLAFAIIVTTEYLVRSARRRRTSGDAHAWETTQTLIRQTLDDPGRSRILADVSAQALAEQTRLNHLCLQLSIQLSVPAVVITVVELEGQRWLAYSGADWCSVEVRDGKVQPLTTSFCKIPVALDIPLIVTDSFDDIRLRDIDGDTLHAVRAYLGVPIHSSRGITIGSLCCFDRVPRRWTEKDKATVQTYANLVGL